MDYLSNNSGFPEQGVVQASPDAYFILEHWGSNMASQRPQLISQGMLCWNNTSEAYGQTAMGWLKSGDSFTSANQDGYVSYCESHDEERNFYKAKTWGTTLLKSDENARLSRIAANTAFNVLLNGPHMIWMFQEVGYDYSINSSYDRPLAYSDGNRTSIKTRPESYGYFKAGIRMQQRNLIAAVCHLRTRLLPTVFDGDPVAVSVASGKALRTIQWGSGAQAVFVAGNFSDSSPEQVTLPTGTWFDFLNGAAAVTSPTLMLAPGELLVLTGSALSAPVLPDSYDEFSAALGNTPATNTAAQKVIRDGHIYIIKDNVWYNIQGTKIK